MFVKTPHRIVTVHAEIASHQEVWSSDFDPAADNTRRRHLGRRGFLLPCVAVAMPPMLALTANLCAHHGFITQNIQTIDDPSRGRAHPPWST